MVFHTNCKLNLCKLYESTHGKEGKIKLRGRVGEEQTILTGSAPSFEFGQDKSFVDVTIQMTIDHGTYVSVKFEGLLMVVAEASKVLAINSIFDFSKPEIEISGKMTGLYEDVFQSGIMDLAVEAEVTGTFTHNAVFDSLTINGFGIVG